MERLSLDNKLLKPMKEKLEKSIDILTKNAILTGKEAEITLKIGVNVTKKDDKDFNEYLEPNYDYQITEKIKEAKGTYKSCLGFNYSVLTVGNLKKALENVPDELEVELWSDSGVDQCDYDDAEVIIEDAYRHTHNLKDGEQFEDGTNKVDYFVIYANYRNEMEEEE